MMRAPPEPLKQNSVDSTNRELTGGIAEPLPQAARRRGWGSYVVWAGLLGLLALVALGLVRTQQGPVGVGQRAPDFQLTTFDGGSIDTRELQGQVILVNFWASWCKPCEQEAADLQAAWELYQARGDVLFLGVDYVDTEKEALAYLERFGITYPNGPDLGTRIYTAFRARGVPETFFINQAGDVVQVQIGPFENLEQITSVIDRILEQ
jgi:cytochrome c biogenesis protein CcmG/thiol:disulfide interchange protein DsbE